MAKKIKEEKDPDNIQAITPEQQLEAYLKDKNNKDNHYNFVPTKYYRVSMGSLTLDSETGMLPPGVHRFVGIQESGKSSAALEVCRNFMFDDDGNTIPNRRALYIDAEGKITPEIKNRSGLNFVTNPVEWKDGTVFILETNIYDFAINLMRDFIKNNKNDYSYLFVLDSIDALITKGDSEKKAGDNVRVAGSPLLTKQFLQNMALAMHKHGHICLLLSQHSSNIVLDSYSKEPQRQIGGAGGWAAMHFANCIVEFDQRFKGDYIFATDNNNHTQENRPLGHYVKVTLKKSLNEKTNLKLMYPVKYGAVGKSSVWKEQELFLYFVGWKMLQGKGAWYNWSANVYKDLIDNGFDVPEKYNGEKQFIRFLEENPNITEFFYRKFRKSLLTSLQAG